MNVRHIARPVSKQDITRCLPFSFIYFHLYRSISIIDIIFLYLYVELTTYVQILCRLTLSGIGLTSNFASSPYL